MKNIRILTTIFVFFLSACSQSNEKSTIKNVEGTLFIGHEVRSFTENGKKQSYWVIDKTGNLISEYKKATNSSIINGQPVSAVLRVEEKPRLSDGFGADYDGTYNVLKIISLLPVPPSLIGEWEEPVSGHPSKFQGFVLESDGQAFSINMATLQYEKWQKKGNKLILSGKSIGNHQTINFVDEYTIKELTSEKLVIQKGQQIFTFQKP